MNTKTSQVAVPAWHAAADAVITNAKGTLGTVPTKAAYAAATLLAPEGRSKGGFCERVMVAMALRPAGTTVEQCKNAVNSMGAHNNWLTALQPPMGQPGGVKRGRFGYVTVTKVGGVHKAVLTAKGAARLKAAGMSPTDIATLSKPAAEPKKAKATTGDKPKAPRKPKAPATEAPQAPTPAS